MWAGLLLAVPASGLIARATQASSWAYLGCVSDGAGRLLSKQVYVGIANTPDYCVNACSTAGYVYAGVEYGTQCWCGNTLDNDQGSLLPSSSCNMACSGSSNKCGGFNTMNLYAHPSTLSSTGCYQDTPSRILPTRGTGTTFVQCISSCAVGGHAYAGIENGSECYCGSSPPNVLLPDSACKPCTYDASSSCGGTWAMNLFKLGGKRSTTVGPAPISSNAATKAVAGLAAPPAAGTKMLWAHFMLGNTYSYTQADWKNDITMAKSAGVDGFALNMGSNDWQPARVADAYAVAASLGGFKLFFSFDMSSLSGTSAADAQKLANLVKTYASHAVTARYAGKPLVSTFAGESSTFGQKSPQDGWNYFRSLAGSIYFIPAQFSDPSTFAAAKWFDGVFGWNGGWPMDGKDITTASDTKYLSALGTRQYMAAISPFFFTYYGSNSWNKNWIYRSDDWLLATRFEQLIAQRSKFDMAQLISWNDFGESHYVGHLARPGDQPMSTAWTDGMPHTALLSLIGHYAAAFKAGKYPANSDKVWLWTRPHSKDAKPTHPTNPRPKNADWTDDYLYAIVRLASPASVILESGAHKATWNLGVGMTKIAIASAPGVIKATIMRNNAVAKKYDSTGAFSYTATPQDYNFNYFVAETQ